eukprot:TRINITY_DN9388_c0_g1_i2.p1 TRINITY_DN9388_c0_g1~~TRINITY_DN9388_c0_g1_i2.p1  ORF type:complete len:328 (-),score=73.48 TRINITY_DN9388_c0_g1_i2:9-992(-)
MSKVFVTRRIPQKALDLLKTGHGVGEVKVNPENRVLTREELLAGVKWCDYLLCQLTDKIDEEVLKANPKLKLVANYAVGFNNVDVKTATSLQIAVTNTPGVLTDTTADLTFALLLATARRIVESDRYMREGKYESWDPLLLLGNDVHHKTIGIVGFGRIGYSVAQRARGFDMNVLYYDVDEKDYASKLGAKLVTMEELITQSDFISLHCFLDESTYHLFGEKQFKMMKKNAIIINTSRGPVIDENALVKALKEGEIAGAGLDVYENEPKMASGLAELNNVVIVPHIGSGSVETRQQMGELAVNNILAHIQGKKLLSCVNSEVFKNKL